MPGGNWSILEFWEGAEVEKHKMHGMSSLQENSRGKNNCSKATDSTDCYRLCPSNHGAQVMPVTSLLPKRASGVAAAPRPSISELDGIWCSKSLYQEVVDV